MPKRDTARVVSIGATIALVVLAVGMIAWAVEFESGRRANAQIELDDTTNRAAEHLVSHVHGVEEFIWLLNDHLEQGTLTNEQIEAKAARYVEGHPAIVAINFADADFVIRWSSPAKENNAVVGLELSLAEPLRASRQAQKTHHSAYTAPFDLVQGVVGFEIYVPAYRGEEFLGTLSVVFSVDSLLTHVLPQSMKSQYNVGLLAGDKIIGEHGVLEPGNVLTSETEVFDGKITVRGSRNAPQRSMLVIVLLGACVIAMILVLSLTLRRRSEREDAPPVQLASAFGELSQSVWLFTTDLNGELLEVSASLARLVGEPSSGLTARISPDTRVKNATRELLLGADAPRHSDIVLKLEQGGEKKLMMFSLPSQADPPQFVHLLLNRRAFSGAAHSTRRGYKATSQSLAQMAGGIAHNFNNLLMAVLGNLEMVLIEPRNTTTTARRMLDDAREAARRAAELSTQMLVYVGQGRRSSKSVDLVEVVSSVVDQIDLSQWKDVEIVKEYSSEVLPVRCDVDQVKKVLSGLMVNAFEALPAGRGALTIKTGECTMSPSAIDELASAEGMKPGPFVWFSISDDGSGIEIHPIQRIFEPFYTTKFAGRGLGLSAAQGIVRGHRGGIDVQSVFGEGTEIKVFFPLPKTNRGRSPSGPHETGIWKGSGTVLLVDDDDSILTLCEVMLRRIGFDVITASDGTAAVEAYEENAGRIKLVLLDLLLPGLSGEQVFEALREKDAQVKIVIVTAFDQRETLQRLPGKHLDGFIHKPFELADLRHQLRRALDEDYSGIEATVDLEEGK